MFISVFANLRIWNLGDARYPFFIEKVRMRGHRKIENQILDVIFEISGSECTRKQVVLKKHVRKGCKKDPSYCPKLTVFAVTPVHPTVYSFRRWTENCQWNVAGWKCVFSSDIWLTMLTSDELRIRKYLLLAHLVSLSVPMCLNFLDFWTFLNHASDETIHFLCLVSSYSR